MIIKILLLVILLNFLLASNVYAHCPLCTVSAAAVAGGAAWLGVSNIIIGLFTGAFAISMGWWVSKLIKRRYIPLQKTIIILLSFFTTILPLLSLPVLSLEEDFYPLYVSLAGDYGSLLNRTYLINLFLTGSVLGGLFVSISPFLSNMITKIRNGKIIPYQGVILTFVLLIITGVIIQFIL